MPYISISSDGKSQVNKDIAFCHLIDGRLPNKNKSFIELISEFDEHIRHRDTSVTGSALSNVHGDWYEWLIAIAGWNYCAENKDAHLILLTPKISVFDIGKLYNAELYDLILDLRHKVYTSSDVQLISSNPDFVIINRELVNRIMPPIEEINTINRETLYYLGNAYLNFEKKCEFTDIIGYVAAKLSLRPDRRLQMAHEGSLMKALYTHLQTRKWIINPRGIRYYGISANINDSDRAALKTVATHSIITVHSTPQAAVDEIFEVDSLISTVALFDKILLP